MTDQMPEQTSGHELRTLDKNFGRWVARRFLDPEDASRGDAQKVATAVSFALGLKHTCLHLEEAAELGEAKLSECLQGIDKDRVAALPDKIIVSGYHQLHRQWAVAWDFAWTNWSTVDVVKIEYANPNQPTTELDFKWDSSVRVAGGVFFTPIQQWTFKLGLAWDQSPIPDETRGPLAYGALECEPLLGRGEM